MFPNIEPTINIFSHIENITKPGNILRLKRLQTNVLWAGLLALYQEQGGVELSMLSVFSLNLPIRCTIRGVSITTTTELRLENRKKGRS